MEGIQFLTNDKGERVAVQIDLRKHADVWEDVLTALPLASAQENRGSRLTLLRSASSSAAN
jgi:hypothetical protein